LSPSARDAVPARVEVYVWFEADPTDEPRVRAAFLRLAQSMVRGGSEAAAETPRLLRRPDTTMRPEGPRATWMEVWPAVPRHAVAGWVDRLAAAAADSGAAALARGGRHVEIFEPVASARGGH
jgi:hypothetical protein